FKTWSTIPVSERVSILWKIYHLILEREEELARTISYEMGKPIRESRSEVKIAAEYVAWNAEEAKRVYGKTVPASIEGKTVVGHPPTGRPSGCDYALEFSVVNGYQKSGSSPCGGVYRCS